MNRVHSKSPSNAQNWQTKTFSGFNVLDSYSHRHIHTSTPENHKIIVTESEIWMKGRNSGFKSKAQ